MQWIKKLWKRLFRKPECKHEYVTVYFPSIFGISKHKSCSKCGDTKESE